MQDLGNKFGFDFRKNFQMQPYIGPQINIPYKTPVEFKLFPGKFSVPKIRKNKETKKTEFYTDKNFEFKSRKLPLIKTVNPDWVALTNNMSGILPAMMVDLQTLNFIEFSSKWRPKFKDLKIKVSETDFLKWSKEVYKTPQFKKSLNKGWDNFYQQKLMSESNPAKFKEIYENGGKGNKVLDITADILNDNTIVKIVPSKKEPIKTKDVKAD